MFVPLFLGRLPGLSLPFVCRSCLFTSLACALLRVCVPLSLLCLFQLCGPPLRIGACWPHAAAVRAEAPLSFAHPIAF